MASARAQRSPSATLRHGLLPPGPRSPTAKSQRPRTTEALSSARCVAPSRRSPRTAAKSSAR
eukprot:11007589-Alexandrium_andersonii.AAC.1